MEKVGQKMIPDNSSIVLHYILIWFKHVKLFCASSFDFLNVYDMIW